MHQLSAQMRDSISGLTPEAQLLLCCSGIEIDPILVHRIKGLLDDGINFHYLLQIARRHGMVQLLYYNLHAVAPEVVPTELHYQYRLNVLRSRFMTQEMLRLLSLLRGHGISAIPYKGPALSAYIYGSISLRQSTDLDILVRPQDVWHARDVLVKAGYKTKSQITPQQDNFWLQNIGEYEIESPNGVMVEVHWRFAQPYFALPPDYQGLWRRVCQIELCGEKVDSLHPEDLLLALCIHGTKHMWEQFNWICDIAALLRRNGQLSWRHLLQQARASGSLRMLFLGLAIVDNLIGLNLPHAVRRKMEADGAAGVLARQSCRRLFQEPRSVINAVQYHIRAKERLRDHFYYYYRFHAQRPASIKMGVEPPFFVWEDWTTLPTSLLFLGRHHPSLRYLFRFLQ